MFFLNRQWFFYFSNSKLIVKTVKTTFYHARLIKMGSSKYMCFKLGAITCYHGPQLIYILNMRLIFSQGFCELVILQFKKNGCVLSMLCLQVQTPALPRPKPLKAVLLHHLLRPHRLIPTARKNRFFLSKNRRHVTSSVATVTAAASQKAERRAAGVCPVLGESPVRRALLGGATLPPC